jgi:hypothetical protein
MSKKTKSLIVITSLILISGIIFGAINFTSSKPVKNAEFKLSSSSISSQNSLIQTYSSSSQNSSTVTSTSSIIISSPILSSQTKDLTKPVSKFNCESKPNEYDEIIDLQNDCLAFSARYMCDFDNKEPEIKELKSQLYQESIKLYNQYKPKLVSKDSLVAMNCDYLDPIYFEFGLNLYDPEYFKQKFGQYSEGPAIRFSKLYSAQKTNGIRKINIIKDTGYDFDNPTKQIDTPPCLFPSQAGVGTQRIVKTEYGCYDLTIDKNGFDLNNPVQNEYFTFRLWDIDSISRTFAKDIFKDFVGQKLYIVAKDINFSSDSTYTFTMDVDNNKEGKYAKKYTLEKKRNNSWVLVK